MLRSLFDYPDPAAEKQPQELVLLRQWDDSQWAALIKHAEMRAFKTGDVVIQTGDTDNSFYIVVHGQLEVLIPYGKSGKMRHASVTTPGTVIGELAFLDSQPRSATLRALTDGEMLQVSRESFAVFAAHEPALARDILFELGRSVSIKLRRADHFISSHLK
jgi:CRP-like cAMP-binding protein